MAFKLDAIKVFDTLDWSFLFKVLYKFGFDEKFIGWIEAIMSSARFSINING